MATATSDQPSTSDGPPTRRRRPLRDLDQHVLFALYRHRLLTTNQLRRMFAPERHVRATQRVLTKLEQRGYAIRSRNERQNQPTRWFLSSAGVELAEASGEVELRDYRMNEAQADASKHLLAVNEVGATLALAAHHHGDMFGYGSWSHEVAHDYGPRTSSKHQLVADAVLNYYVTTPAGVIAEWRFVELDRGHMDARRLYDKIRAYAQFSTYEPVRRDDSQHLAKLAWRRHYVTFPGLLFVFDCEPTTATARVRLLADLVASDELLTALKFTPVATTLGALTRQGPFERIGFRIPTLEAVPLFNRK